MWALFPDRLDDAKPFGWRHTMLGEICDRVAMGPFGSDIKTDNFVEEGVPVVRGGNLRNGFVDRDFVFLTEAKADDLKNAIAFPGDIVVTHRGTLGQVGVIPKNASFPRYVGYLTAEMLSSPDEKEDLSFDMYLSFFDPTSACSNCSRLQAKLGVPAISSTDDVFEITRYCCSNKNGNATAFDEVLRPLIDRENANRAEIDTLAAARDLLLPKLMSGDIRVKHAEKLAERAA